ncbi:MAG TPA: PAS domain S-box protein [Anaerolineales bacterium]|nr:PAS domain S-box protein [Anaerolineales bacterium]
MQNIVNLAPVNVNKDPSFSQKILDALPFGVVSVDALGKIQYMNRVARSLLGEPDQALVLGQWPQRFGLYLTDASVLCPEDKLPLARALYGETVEAEEMILRKEGEQPEIWITMSTQPLSNEQGMIDGAIACIQDVSHRKQGELSREKQVQRIEALYNFLYSIAEAGNDLSKIMSLAAEFTANVIGDLSTIALLNADGDKLNIGAFHDIAPAAQAMLSKLLVPNFEYEHSQTLARVVIQSGESLLLPSVTAEQLQAVTLPIFDEFVREFGIKSVLIVPLMGKTGVVGTMSLARHPGSKPFHVEDQSFLTEIAYHVARAIEKYRLFESLLKEITERLTAKQALERSEERFHTLFESVTVGIKVLDLNGDILHTNSAFQNMIGYTDAELVGRKFHDFLYPEDVAHGIELFQDVKLKDVSNFRFEHRAVHKDGSVLWVKTIFTVIKPGMDNMATGFVAGIVENITEQKRLETEMAELSSRLQTSVEVERLRVAQELHDGPMQSLHSAIYRIEELRAKSEAGLADELREVKETIQSVLQDLRATAKELRPPTISSFGLENAIRSHANDMAEKDPHLEIRLSLAHDGQILPEKIRLGLFRIFQQCMSNVTRHADATQVRVRFSFDAEEAHLEISDNGKGFEVPPNWIEFVRQGHYGLAGAAERATALGGVLSVESKPGNSTTVHVRIPWWDTDE